MIRLINTVNIWVLLTPLVCFGADEITCLTLMEKWFEKTTTPKGLKTEVELSSVLETTVVITKASKGRFGGKILTLKRVGETWGSSKRTVGFDPQGDPRSFIVAVGESTARFFGFKMQSDREMTIPDVKEFNGAIRELNRLSKKEYGEEFTDIKFYRQRKSISILADYLKKWAKQALLPVGKETNHFFHDVSFHTSAIFLPKDIILHNRRSAQFLEDFLTYLDKNIKTKSPERKKAIERYKFVMRLTHASSTDSLTAHVAEGLIHYLSSKNPTSRDQRSATGAMVNENTLARVLYQSTLGPAYSAETYLRSRVKLLEENPYTVVYGSNGKPIELANHRQALPIAEITEALINFESKARYANSNLYTMPVNAMAAEQNSKPIWNQNKRPQTNEVVQDLCKRLSDRRSRAVILVEKFFKEHPDSIDH